MACVKKLPSEESANGQEAFFRFRNDHHLRACVCFHVCVADNPGLQKLIKSAQVSLLLSRSVPGATPEIWTTALSNRSFFTNAFKQSKNNNRQGLRVTRMNERILAKPEQPFLILRCYQYWDMFIKLHCKRNHTHIPMQDRWTGRNEINKIIFEPSARRKCSCADSRPID